MQNLFKHLFIIATDHLGKNGINFFVMFYMGIASSLKHCNIWSFMQVLWHLFYLDPFVERSLHLLANDKC